MTEKYCVELLYPPNSTGSPDVIEEASAVAGLTAHFSLSDVATKYNLPRLAYALHTYYCEREEDTAPIEDLIADPFKSMRVLRSFLPVKYEESLSSLRCVADDSYYGAARFDHVQIAGESYKWYAQLIRIIQVHGRTSDVINVAYVHIYNTVDLCDFLFDLPVVTATEPAKFKLVNINAIDHRVVLRPKFSDVHNLRFFCTIIKTLLLVHDIFTLNMIHYTLYTSLFFQGINIYASSADESSSMVYYHRLLPSELSC